MSIEPEALDRSVLESKGRDELQAIAAAIGAKPGSRARKAQIVDSILAATGVGNGSSAPAEVAATPGPASIETASAVPKAAAVESVSSTDAASAPTDNRRARPAPAGSSFSADPWADAADEADAAAARRTRMSDGPAGNGDGAGGDAAADLAPAESDSGPEAGSTEPPSGGSPADGGAEASTETPASVAAAPAPSGSTDSDEPASGQQAKGETGRNRDGARSKDDQGEGRNNRDRQGRNNRDRTDRDRNDRDRTDRDRNDRDRTDRDRNRGEVAEPGNRRRRRRGRDRDRERGEDEAVGDPIEVEGILDLRDEGYGFLRTRGFLASRDDVYVGAKQVRQFGMRKGDIIKGMSRPAARSEKNPALLKVDTVGGLEPDKARERRKFEDLTPLFPDVKLRLEQPEDPSNMTARIVDLISPIGKGQRGLIVSPPKAGKTTIMKTIATSIEANDPNVHLMVLLVDERPEEVTDMRRTVRGEVIASTFDRPSDEHTQLAELAIERAKRLVETGKDVVIILDGITRLARAYNLAAPATGRIMSGGVDSGALYPPKRFFGAARNLEEGGSLTILATALIETGSKMDEVIFEEFKGTGNMELRLDRRLAERRIYPAIDVDASSTRQEQLLFDRRQYPQVMKLRRVLSGLAGGDGDGDRGRPGAGLELMVDRLKTFRTNDEFLAEIAKAPS